MCDEEAEGEDAEAGWEEDEVDEDEGGGEEDGEEEGSGRRRGRALAALHDVCRRRSGVRHRGHDESCRLHETQARCAHAPATIGRWSVRTRIPSSRHTGQFPRAFPSEDQRDHPMRCAIVRPYQGSRDTVSL